MSVKEPAVSNRYLDLKEKEKAYRKHMSALSRARPTINTTQPEPARRIVQADKHSSDYRKNLIRHMKVHTQLMSSVSPKSKTKKAKDSVDWNALSARRPTKPNEYTDIGIFQNDYDRFRPRSQFKPIRPTNRKKTDSSSEEFEDPTVSSSSDSQENFETNYNPVNHKAPSVSSKSSSIKPEVKNETIRIGYAPDEKLENEKVKSLKDQLSTSSKSQQRSHDVSSTLSSKSQVSYSSKSSKKGAPSTNQLQSILDAATNALTQKTGNEPNDKISTTSTSQNKSDVSSKKPDLSSNFEDSSSLSDSNHDSTQDTKSVESNSKTQNHPKDDSNNSSLDEMISGLDNNSENGNSDDFDNFDEFD